MLDRALLKVVQHLVARDASLARDPEAAASTFAKFGRYDLSEYEVNPLIETLLFTHPSVNNRIRRAQEWAKANPAN